MPVRILIVDDFEPFRKYLCSALEQEAELQVVGQASDGLEAVQKAAELQPDLVLLDIGLPNLNGIEAARRTLKLAPTTKILFISDYFSLDMLEAAIRLGAFGYIHKPRAGKELLPAIRAVSQRKYFVSGSLKEKSRESSNHNGGIRHEVQFYSDDMVLVESFADYIASQRMLGKTVLLVATESHRAGVLQKLKTMSVDVDQAIAAGTIIPIDAPQTLSRLLANGMPNPDQVFDFMQEIVQTASKASTKDRGTRVAACGEIAPLLLAQGKFVEALQLERLWDVASHRCSLDTLCAYALAELERDKDLFQSISVEHSAVHSR